MSLPECRLPCSAALECWRSRNATATREAFSVQKSERRSPCDQEDSNVPMEESNPIPENNEIVTETPRFAGQAEPVRVGAPPTMPTLRIPRVNRVLFLLTLLTTTMAGAAAAGADVSLFHPLDTMLNLPTGLSFSIPLMAILLAHEMGHFLTARRYGVDSSLPYFIPVLLPSP